MTRRTPILHAVLGLLIPLAAAPGRVEAQPLRIDFDTWTEDCLAAGMCEGHRLVTNADPFELCDRAGTQCLQARFEDDGDERTLRPNDTGWQSAGSELWFRTRMRVVPDDPTLVSPLVRGYVKLLRVPLDGGGSGPALVLEARRGSGDGAELALAVQGLPGADALCTLELPAPMGWHEYGVRIAIDVDATGVATGICALSYDRTWTAGRPFEMPVAAFAPALGPAEVLGSAVDLTNPRDFDWEVSIDDVCFADSLAALDDVCGGAAPTADAGVSDGGAPPGVDAGVAPGVDAGASPLDAGRPNVGDGGANPPGTDGVPSFLGGGGCNCRVTPPRGGGAGGLLLVAVGLGLGARRRRRRAISPRRSRAR